MSLINKLEGKVEKSKSVKPSSKNSEVASQSQEKSQEVS